ncbi:MAG: hypothetical protein IJ493_02785 [Clostridia bacterium]|nr:hypothetical protein [Clostridia bacterium]
MNKIGILLVMMMLANTAAVTIDENLPEYDYSDLDCHGATYTVLHEPSDSDAYTMFPEECNGNIVNDSAYARKIRTEEQHNVKIEAFVTEDAKRMTQNAVLAADDCFEIASLSVTELTPLAISGFFYDLNKVEDLQLDQPWWNQSINESLSIGDEGYLFAAAADVSFTSFDEVSCVYFNREALGDSLYQTVREGNWTLDKLLALAKDGSIDLNGSADAAALLAGAGESFLAEDAEGNISLNKNDSRLYDVVDKLTAVWSKKAAEDSDALFAVATVGDSADYGEGWGVLPMPKYDRRDDYTSLVTNHFEMLVMPIFIRDSKLEMVGTVTDALAYNSTKYGLEMQYYEAEKDLSSPYAALKKDSDNMQMLRLIRDSRTLDTGIAYGMTNRLTAALPQILETGSLASSIAANEQVIQKTIDYTLEAVDELDR